MTNAEIKSEANTAVESNLVTNSDASIAKVPATKPRKNNALTHGIYAEDLILEWESEGDLMKVRDEVWEELQPEGRLEEETVLGIVHLTWLKRRVMRTAELGFRRDPFAVAVSASSPKNLDDLVQLIASTAGEKEKLSGACKDSIVALKAAADKITEINMECVKGYNQPGPAKEAFEAAQKAHSSMEFVEKFFNEQVFERMLAVEEAAKASGGNVSVYEKAYSYEHLEKALRLQAALGARLDKELARLVNLKEFKRVRKEISLTEHKARSPVEVLPEPASTSD